ncbi:MAG: class I SAM-dependent methyltransferase [Desulfovibrionaceae bacterium]
MTSYSCSKFDATKDPKDRERDEQSLTNLYKTTPYPGPHVVRKKRLLGYLAPIETDLARRKRVRVLDAGCGTGPNIVSVGMAHPEWHLHAMDLSDASIEIAKRHAELNNVTVDIKQGSYVDKIPFDGVFDLIIATGTIHHCADPVQAMKNIREKMDDNGYFLISVYGEFFDNSRLFIKEILDMLQPDITNYRERFQLYDALMQSYKEYRKNLPLKTKIGRLCLADIRDWIVAKISRSSKRSAPYGPRWAWISGPDDPHWNAWPDSFCNPCERTYNMLNFRELIEASGFAVVHMLSQGARRTYPIPKSWGDAYHRLDDWSKWRVDELMHYPDGLGINAILRKA